MDVNAFSGSVLGQAPTEVPDDSGNPNGLFSDDVTPLGDRFSLKEHLARTVGEAPPSGPRPALLLLDLDGFKKVNHTHGQVAGDHVLRLTGGRLLTAVARAGTAFRAGGDEFAVLLDRATPLQAVTMAGRLLSVVREPIETEGASIEVSASIGVVMLGDRQRADAVLRDADVTMYRVKAAGGNRVDIYSRSLDDWMLTRNRDLDSLAREVDELRLENKILKEGTTLDARTGLPDRGAFDADHLWVYAGRRRSGVPYSVVLAEVDSFYDADERGRLGPGDKAVRAVAGSIRDTVRLGDRAYYFDGDRFAVLLPGTDLRRAVAAAGRIRSAVQALAVPHPNSPSGVVTVTVAVIEVGSRHASATDVLEEADVLLIRGQDAGRNRVSWQ